MKIYTRTGDGGATGLLGAGRVPKDHPRVEALGAIDELNAAIGSALGELSSEIAAARLAMVQHDLFALGSHMASAPQASETGQHGLPGLPRSRPAEMEAWIDEEEALLEPLRAFVLPGGSPGARALHLCRTVCRRAERRVVALGAAAEASFAILYLNRLSDFLFVLARSENRIGGVEDVRWKSEPA